MHLGGVGIEGDRDDRALLRRAVRMSCDSTCWCPRCTPSKLPNVTTVGPKSAGTSDGSFQMWTINLAFYCLPLTRPESRTGLRNSLRLPAIAHSYDPESPRGN